MHVKYQQSVITSKYAHSSKNASDSATAFINQAQSHRRALLSRNSEPRYSIIASCKAATTTDGYDILQREINWSTVSRGKTKCLVHAGEHFFGFSKRWPRKLASKNNINSVSYVDRKHTHCILAVITGEQMMGKKDPMMFFPFQHLSRLWAQPLWDRKVVNHWYRRKQKIKEVLAGTLTNSLLAYASSPQKDSLIFFSHLVRISNLSNTCRKLLESKSQILLKFKMLKQKQWPRRTTEKLLRIPHCTSAYSVLSIWLKM